MQHDVDEQLQVLMQGTEYGDAQLAAKMRAELRERLIAEASEHVLGFDWVDVARETSELYDEALVTSRSKA